MTSATLPQEVVFTVHGAPPVQQRPKMVWKLRKSPVYYDPSAMLKVQWRGLLKKELVGCGVNVFPFFNNETPESSKGISLDITFFLMRRRADYCMKKGVRVLKDRHQLYPGFKDTDNMVKFVMDALHIVMYRDDKCVVRVTASKQFVDESDIAEGAYTKIRISKVV